MKIAILGGSFDPPHLGHIFISQQVREFYNLDQVWLMPVFRPNFDKVFEKNLTSYEMRFEMAKLLENDYIKVTDFEKEYNPGSITIDTLDLLAKIYPQDTFYWVSGSDQLVNFQKYDKWKEIIDLHNIIFFPREYSLPDFEEVAKKCLGLRSIPKNVILLQNNNLILTNISSTIIRRRVGRGLSINNFVPSAVEEFIYKNKLYQKNEG